METSTGKKRQTLAGNTKDAYGVKPDYMRGF